MDRLSSKNVEAQLSNSDSRYTSKIIKAGALLADTKTLLSHWDSTETVPANLERLQRENVFGKAPGLGSRTSWPSSGSGISSKSRSLRALVVLVKMRLPAPPRPHPLLSRRQGRPALARCRDRDRSSR